MRINQCLACPEWTKSVWLKVVVTATGVKRKCESLGGIGYCLNPCKYKTEPYKHVVS